MNAIGLEWEKDIHIKDVNWMINETEWPIEKTRNKRKLSKESLEWLMWF